MNYEIRDPWRERVREWWAQHVTCRVFGHQQLRKFGGTVVCRRCSWTDAR